jgi:hypothetical protein
MEEIKSKSIRFLFQESKGFNYYPPTDRINTSDLYNDAFVIDIKDDLKDEGSAEDWDCCKDYKE